MTVRAIGLMLERLAKASGAMSCGTTPADCLKPTTPLQAAGMRVEPPASVPTPIGHDAGGQRDRRAARGAAAGAVRRPGIARAAEQRRLGVGHVPELGRRGLADQDGAGLLQPRDRDASPPWARCARGCRRRTSCARPLVLTRSLTWNGTPCSGPSVGASGERLRRRLRHRRAPDPAQMVMKQLQAACTFSARASVARITSTAETSLGADHAREIGGGGVGEVGWCHGRSWMVCEAGIASGVGRNSDSVLRRASSAERRNTADAYCALRDARETGSMQIGIVGLGRMGANIARRLMRHGHACVVYDRDPEPGRKLAARGCDGVREPRPSWCRRWRRRARCGSCCRRALRRRPRSPSLPRCSQPATRSSTAATPSGRTTSAAPRELKAEGHPLPRRRHVRRRVGARARLLPDDRRRQGGRRAARSDLRRARARQGRHSRHARAARAATAAPSRATCTPARAAPGTSSR